MEWPDSFADEVEVTSLIITEVRVKLMRTRSDRLRAFCSITIDDDFVIHDLRVIEGRKGFFVAMPSRKLTDNCPNCGSKNELRAAYCNNCGEKLDASRATEGPDARDKFHVDVAHPINTPCREMIQETVLAAYEAEIERVEEGLEPQRQYGEEGLEELTDEYEGYDEYDYDEEEEKEPPEAPESTPEPEAAEAEEPRPEPEPEEPQAEEPQPEPEEPEIAEPEPPPQVTEAPTAEPEPPVPQAEPVPGPVPVLEPEMEEPEEEPEEGPVEGFAEAEEEEEEEEDTGFGAGLF